ncbi:MAG: ribbon-helix-helix domain-containing protein [Rhodospirillaceae bacterium]
MGSIVKRSVSINGHLTSVSMEQEFWDALKGLARHKGLSLQALIAEIDQSRSGGLSSALRVYVLQSIEARLKRESIVVS